MAEEDIDLKVLYSSPDAKGHFSIDAGKLASREALNINITEMAYDIIQAKDYILEGTCGHIKDWKKEGDELRQTSVENEQQWKITVFIDNCNP